MTVSRTFSKFFFFLFFIYPTLIFAGEDNNSSIPKPDSPQCTVLDEPGTVYEKLREINKRLLEKHQKKAVTVLYKSMKKQIPIQLLLPDKIGIIRGIIISVQLIVKEQNEKSILRNKPKPTLILRVVIHGTIEGLLAGDKLDLVSDKTLIYNLMDEGILFNADFIK